MVLRPTGTDASGLPGPTHVSPPWLLVVVISGLVHPASVRGTGSSVSLREASHRGPDSTSPDATTPPAPAPTVLTDPTSPTAPTAPYFASARCISATPWSAAVDHPWDNAPRRVRGPRPALPESPLRSSRLREPHLDSIRHSLGRRRSRRVVNVGVLPSPGQQEDSGRSRDGTMRTPLVVGNPWTLVPTACSSDGGHKHVRHGTRRLRTGRVGRGRPAHSTPAAPTPKNSFAPR